MATDESVWLRTERERHVIIPLCQAPTSPVCLFSIMCSHFSDLLKVYTFHFEMCQCFKCGLWKTYLFLHRFSNRRKQLHKFIDWADSFIESNNGIFWCLQKADEGLVWSIYLSTHFNDCFFFCDRRLSSNRIASLPERVFAALINLKRLWVKLYYIVFKMTLCAKPSFLIRGSVRVYAVAFWHRIAYFICLLVSVVLRNLFLLAEGKLLRKIFLFIWYQL